MLELGLLFATYMYFYKKEILNLSDFFFLMNVHIFVLTKNSAYYSTPEFMKH